MLYKLGDGPINYDWNLRYVSIESTEIVYSPSPHDKERKTLNIYGGAISNICKIKGKNFAFCVVLPPPTCKTIYFASDSYEDAILARNKMIKATLNSSEKEENLEQAEIISRTIERSDLKKGNESVSAKIKDEKLNTNLEDDPNYNINNKTTKKEICFENGFHNNRNKFVRDELNISEEFLNKLETLRNQVIMDDDNFFVTYEEGLKVSVPKEYYEKRGYFSFIKFLVIKLVIVMSILHMVYYTLNKCCSIFIDLKQGYISVFLFYSLEMALFYFCFKKIFYVLSNNKLVQILFKSKNILKNSHSNSDSNSDYLAKSSTIIESNPTEIMNVLIDFNKRYKWDYFIKHKNEIRIDNRKSMKCKIKFGLPFIKSDYLTEFCMFLINIFSGKERRNKVDEDNAIVLENFNYPDENENFYVTFRETDGTNVTNSKESTGNKSAKFRDGRLLEVFLLIPLKEDYKSKDQIDDGFEKNKTNIPKTLVIFLTNFNPNNYISGHSLPFFMIQKYKEYRLGILSTLKENIQNKSYDLGNIILPSLVNTNCNNSIYSEMTRITGTNILNQNPLQTQIQFSQEFRNDNISHSQNCHRNIPLAKFGSTPNQKNSASYLINEDPINFFEKDKSIIQAETMNTYQSVEEENLYPHLNRNFHTISQNMLRKNKSESMELRTITRGVITHGRRVSLEERYPGYSRYPQGGVECKNIDELKKQDGLIVELMKRVGKQLLEGKNLVAVSLPVRIFEPRSTLERISDLWGAGPHYLNKAVKTLDPIERMKIIIAFAISGMHTNIKQLKPFNPILGETYEVKFIFY